MKFILYHHKNRALANYVFEYSILKSLNDSGVATFQIESEPQQNNHKTFAELPASMRRLLFFAKPDLVICMDDGIKPIEPIFAFEVTKHVPARDHWMQRFVNLVGCAQEGVPGAYIMPFDLSQRRNFSGTIDHVFFYAYERVMAIHNTPFYIANWESDAHSTLKPDAKFGADMPDHAADDMRKAFMFLNLVIEYAMHGRDFATLMNHRLFVDLRDQIRKYAYSQLPQVSDFERLKFNMPNGNFLTFDELKQWTVAKGHAVPADLPDRIEKRSRNLIFVPQSEQSNKTPAQLRTALVTRISQKGGDPYLGQPLAFDYIFCRLGETPYERDTNVVIDLSVLRFSDLAQYHQQMWQTSPLQHTDFDKIDHIPQYTMQLTEGFSHTIKNFLRVYAFTADIIVFSDGLIYF